MSTFFKALERAEQERALRQPAPPVEPTDQPDPAAPAPGPALVGSAPAVEAAPRPRPLREVAPARAPESTVKAPRQLTVSQGKALDEEPAGLEEHLVSLLAPTSFEAEQYRALRHLIEQHDGAAPLSIIAVSSPDAGDGKTTTAINLAGALAQAHDTRVLLVDGDLRGANLANHLGLEERAPGLVDAILDTKIELSNVVQRHPYLNLSLIPAGRRSSAPYEVLKSPRVGELFAKAREKFDYVIVDTPPLVSIPDSRVIAKWVDGFLVVVAAHRTPRRLVEDALNLLEAGKIVGLVFNGDDRHVSLGVYSSHRQRIARSGIGRKQTASE